MKKLLLTVFILSFLLLSKENVLAAKPRLRPGGIGDGGGVIAFSTVKLRPDRLAALVSLYNLSGIESISYSLTYYSNGVEQGVSGTIDPLGQNSINRELLFGTCSKNVCTYNRNIKNMHLRFVATTKSGRTLVKGYLIKV
ncbi:MAG: hypothetical protein M1120_03090 [Patescibacteria group bacterium]|nr:hypothetical protein [Patescibacteria group bacterium]